MRSLSLVMSERSLSGRGHGHVSNFYIVDLENFATASRRYTGDIHNSTVVDLCKNCSHDPDRANLGNTHSSQDKDIVWPTRVQKFEVSSVSRCGDFTWGVKF